VLFIGSAAATTALIYTYAIKSRATDTSHQGKLATTLHVQSHSDSVMKVVLFSISTMSEPEGIVRVEGISSVCYGCVLVCSVFTVSIHLNHSRYCHEIFLV